MHGEKMSFRDIKSYLILSLLFLGTIAAVHFTGEPRIIREPSIKLELPASVGPWTGTDVFFCQNEKCMAEITEDQLGDEFVCPLCGGSLDGTSLAERKHLPVDTILLKKKYKRLSGEKIFVSIVVTGARRSSIHRPQWCLPGQGHVIESSRVIEVPIEKRNPLRVMLLDLRKQEQSTSGGERSRAFAYAYWFVSKKRESPYHLQRLFWMAVDNIFHGVSQRWAYIAVATDRREGLDEHIKRITEFIANLYPLIKKG